MKKNLFICDCCGKHESCEVTHYLYSKGWVYIYNSAIKVDENNYIEMKDKHFCSLKCLTKWIEESKVKKYIDDD